MEEIMTSTIFWPGSLITQCRRPLLPQLPPCLLEMWG